MPKLVASMLIVCGLVLLGANGAQAAMKAQTLTRQQTVGPYRVVLKIGPAESMSMNGMSGERTLGGHMATCHIGKAKAGMAMDSGTCNHLVEVHVYQAKTGKVVTNARVSIMLRDAAKRMSVTVPIMAMEDPHLGKADLHYGNNIHASAGKYTVTVHVGKYTAVFGVELT